MDKLTQEEIKESTQKAVETSIPIVERLVVEDSLFYKALRALDIKPIIKDQF